MSRHMHSAGSTEMVARARLDGNGRGHVLTAPTPATLGGATKLMRWIATQSMNGRPLSPRLAAIRDILIGELSKGADARPFVHPLLRPGPIWETPAFVALLEAFSEERAPRCPYCGADPLQLGVPDRGAEIMMREASLYTWDSSRGALPALATPRAHGLRCGSAWGVYHAAEDLPLVGHHAAWCLSCGREDSLLYVAAILLSGHLGESLRPNRTWWVVKHFNKLPAA